MKATLPPALHILGFAIRSQTRYAVGLRSPLTNRTSGNAHVSIFDNTGSAFLPAAGWTANTPAAGYTSLQTLALGGRGIRSIQWCPQLNAPTGAYLIVAGPANGGPLKNETGKGKFALYKWNGPGSAAVLAVADLAPFGVRPEGANIILLNGTPRVVFVEDRYKAEGYDTQNAVHWPLAGGLAVR